MKLGRRLAVAAALFVSSALTGVAWSAETFPSRPVHVVTVLPVGADTYVRTLSARMGEIIGQPVIVENRLGASGALALQYIVASPPDGHTLLVHSPAFLITRHVQSRGFEAVDDLVPVAQIYGGGASVLVVASDSPLRSIDGLVAKGRSGKLSYGSGGAGFPAHLAAESLLQAAKTKALHVPYKSTADYLQAILRGDVDFALGVVTSSMPLIRSGKLRALGVTSNERLRDLPDVPTLREVLKSDLLIQEFWAGLAAPPKTSGETARAVNAAAVKALADATVRRSIEATSNVPGAGEGAEAFAAFVRRENERWREIVRQTGIKPE